jgi:hypothetical protein
MSSVADCATANDVAGELFVEFIMWETVEFVGRGDSDLQEGSEKTKNEGYLGL